MESDISDDFGDCNSNASCQNNNNGTDYQKESDESVCPTKWLDQLVKEHGALSREFLYEASLPRYQQCEENLEQKLNSLKTFWCHQEWAALHLDSLFCRDEFRKDVLNIVEFFGNELKKCRGENPQKFRIGQMSYSTSTRLLSFIIPIVLKLLRSVHALWRDDAMITMPTELKEARIKKNSGQISCFPRNEDDIGQWLHVIRERGYNLLGLCASIQRAFCEMLEISSIGDAIMENLTCMEFRHVSMLIDLVLIPLVKYCPPELLGEWILKLLQPLFRHYCEAILCDAWFNLLNEGPFDYLHYFGYLCGSEDSVKKLEYYLLLDLIRKVSKLLGVLASLEPFGTVKAASLCDSKCASSCSVVGYTLLNGCFGLLQMSLLGSWVDGEATLYAVPFCHALVQVAVATNNRKLRRFILDDMLPATIKRLCDDLPCAVQQTIKKLSDQLDSSKSKKASQDLLVLCEVIYKVYIHSHDFTAEDPDSENIRDRFKDWLARQKQEFLGKASCAIPIHFPVNLWNWEFEDELERYLPTYIDILYEVDAMDYGRMYDYSCRSSLIEKLRPEFRLKHDISIDQDRHVRMIDKMMQRKIHEEDPKRRCHQLDKWLCKLITSKPYAYKRHTAYARLMEDLATDAKPSHLDVQEAVNVFSNVVLFYLEPQFHPLIRKGQKEFLIKIAHQFIFADETNCGKPLEPESDDFPRHLQRHARSYINRMKIESKYFEAIEHVRLQQEFDDYLASGELDDDIYYYKFSSSQTVEEFADKHLARSRFGKLDYNLIRLSLEDRAQIVDKQRQIDTYSENLRNVLASEELKDRLERLMAELEEEGFFDVDNDFIDWEKACFVSLIDRFRELVFRGHRCPQHVAVQGIMEYREISRRSDKAAQVSLEKVVEAACHKWKQNVAELWMDTRYYEETFYHDLLRNPLKKILPWKDET